MNSTPCPACGAASEPRVFHECGATCGACKGPLDAQRDAICLDCCSEAEEADLFDEAREPDQRRDAMETYDFRDSEKNIPWAEWRVRFAAVCELKHGADDQDRRYPWQEWHEGYYLEGYSPEDAWQEECSYA